MQKLPGHRRGVPRTIANRFTRPLAKWVLANVLDMHPSLDYINEALYQSRADDTHREYGLRAGLSLLQGIPVVKGVRV